MNDLSGNYPAPPYMPDRLAGGHCPPWFVALRLDLIEDETPLHTYVQDGYPGPCVMVFQGDQFADWFPCLTLDRAEEKAVLS